jgi:hypothetical protein
LAISIDSSGAFAPVEAVECTKKRGGQKAGCASFGARTSKDYIEGDIAYIHPGRIPIAFAGD